MGKIERIIIHCSDSLFGNALMIDGWHKDRGWNGIGYNRVVLNGYSDRTGDYDSFWSHLDGTIETGRPLDADRWLEADEVGAHAYGYNHTSIGICMIGQNGIFSPRQFITVRAMIEDMLCQWGLNVSAIVGHYELDDNKTCPDIHMDMFRDYIAGGSQLTDLCKPYVQWKTKG